MKTGPRALTPAAASAFAAAIADRLASPAAVRELNLVQGWVPQSLAYGAAGVALLHTERALTGDGSWSRVHDWLACAAGEAVAGGDGSHLHYGAPALAVAVRAAAADRRGRYARAQAALDPRIAATTHRSLDRAHARMDRGELPALAEFDAIRGLTGLGVLALRHEPHTDLARDVLTYLVRLTEPIQHDGDHLPGWWTLLAPSGRLSPRFPGGHANHGMAHGISGPLALLSLAARRGILVDGHLDAIHRICAWLDRWRHDGPAAARWPYWITRAEYRHDPSRPDPSRPDPADTTQPSRPSWCYGTAGLARAQQLAALATGQDERQRRAEGALLAAMTDPRQLATIGDISLCHGYAGLAHITRLTAADALTPGLAAALPTLLTPLTSVPAETLTTTLHRPARHTDIGFLEGATGVALALLAHARAAHPGAGTSTSGWDSCLLLT